LAVVTALWVREWCGDLIAGGAKLGTITLTFNKLLIAGGGLLMSGRMKPGRWSDTSSFLAGALPGGLTTCLSFFLVPVSFLALGVGVEPTVLTVFPVLGGGALETGLSLSGLAVLLPALLMMSFVALVMMSLMVGASSSAGDSGAGAGVGRRAGVGVEPTPGLADVLPSFGIT
jgi:hypothetical protein